MENHLPAWLRVDDELARQPPIAPVKEKTMLWCKAAFRYGWEMNLAVTVQMTMLKRALDFE